MTTGPIAALTYAVGEQLNQLAGVRLTRLARAARRGDRQLVVERSLGMAEQGVVVVDGITYAYGSLVDGALGDLSVKTPQGSFDDVYQDHALNAVVTDANRDYSSLDSVRQSLFVATAEGEDLSLLGRILGVPREPAVADDAQYRSLIRAIAYNPRTTLQGLNAALNALVGPGNYAVVEDPVNYPSTVLVYLSGEDLVGTQSQGRAFVAGEEPVTLAGGVLVLAGPVLNLGALHLAPVAFWRTFGGKPSLATTDDAGAALPGAFKFEGDEATTRSYALGPNGQTAPQLSGPGRYFLQTPLADAAEWRAAARALVPNPAKLSRTDPRAFGVRVRTQGATFAWGAVQAPDGSVGLGLANMAPDGGSLVAPIAATRPANTLFEAAIALAGDQIELWVDNRRVQSIPRAAAKGPALAPTGFEFGSFSAASADVVVQAAGLNARDMTDFNSVFGSATPRGANLLELNFAPLPGDVGKSIRVIAGGGASASQGQARDSYPITAVSSKTVTVGDRDLGPVNISDGQLYCSGVEQPLTYPDDIGRKVTLTGSRLGIDGTYTISAVLNEDGSAALNRREGAPPVRSQYATLTPKPGRSETQVSASLAPNFGSAAAEVQLVGTWEGRGLSDDGASFTPRSPLPFEPGKYHVTASHVLSAQVFDDLGSVNYRLSDSTPPKFLIWPLYLTDPTFFVQTYLQGMLAAGVRLKVMAGLKDIA